MGKEDSSGPVELKGDDSEKEEIDNNTNTEVRCEKVLTVLSYFKASAGFVDKVNIITFNLQVLHHPYGICQLTCKILYEMFLLEEKN